MIDSKEIRDAAVEARNLRDEIGTVSGRLAVNGPILKTKHKGIFAEHRTPYSRLAGQWNDFKKIISAKNNYVENGIVNKVGLLAEQGRLLVHKNQAENLSEPNNYNGSRRGIEIIFGIDRIDFSIDVGVIGNAADPEKFGITESDKGFVAATLIKKNGKWHITGDRYAMYPPNTPEEKMLADFKKAVQFTRQEYTKELDALEISAKDREYKPVPVTRRNPEKPPAQTAAKAPIVVL